VDDVEIRAPMEESKKRVQKRRDAAAALGHLQQHGVDLIRGRHGLLYSSVCSEERPLPAS